MSPFSRSNVSAKAGPNSHTSESTTGDRDKQWLSRLHEWKAPEMKLPKLPRASFLKKSKKGKGKLKPDSTPASDDSEQVNNLPPLPEFVTLIPSVPPGTSSPTFNSCLPEFNPFPVTLGFKPSLPSIWERHSSSSSDYGHSYRSRSSSGPSVYHGSDPSFPYPLRYDSPESKSDDHQSLERRSLGSSRSISPPIPAGEGAAQFISEPDRRDNDSPMQRKPLHDMSARGPKLEPQLGPSRSMSQPPPFPNRSFSVRDTDTPSFPKIARCSHPKNGGSKMASNQNEQGRGPPTMGMKDRDDPVGPQIGITNPFPHPVLEDSDCA